MYNTRMTLSYAGVTSTPAEFLFHFMAKSNTGDLCCPAKALIIALNQEYFHPLNRARMAWVRPQAKQLLNRSYSLSLVE